MKTRFAPFAITLLFGALASACTPAAQQQFAKDVLDIVTTQCIMQHSEDPTIETICKYEPAKAQIVKQLIGTQNDVLAKTREAAGAKVRAELAATKKP